MGPVIIVFPDCFTALGGNQYVNSSAIGNYADLRRVVEYWQRSGMSESRVRKIAMENYARVLRQALAGRQA